MMRTPNVWLARKALDEYSEPLDLTLPTHWGGPRLTWKLTVEDGLYVVAGYEDGS